MFALPAFLGTLQAKVIGALVCVAVIALAVHSTVSSIQSGAVAKVEAAGSQHARKIEAAQAPINIQAAATGTQHQADERAATKEIIKRVPYYVHDKVDRPCVSYGLVRLLDAAALGVGDPGELGPPPGAGPGYSDDACSPLADHDLARAVAGNYGVARGNAKQLNDLIDHDTKVVAAFNGQK